MLGFIRISFSSFFVQILLLISCSYNLPFVLYYSTCSTFHLYAISSPLSFLAWSRRSQDPSSVVRGLLQARLPRWPRSFQLSFRWQAPQGLRARLWRLASRWSQGKILLRLISLFKTLWAFWWSISSHCGRLAFGRMIQSCFTSNLKALFLPRPSLVFIPRTKDCFSTRLHICSIRSILFLTPKCTGNSNRSV